MFIDNPLELQCEIYAKILKKLKRRINAQKKEKNIATLMTRRDLGELGRLEFIQYVSFKLQ